MKRFVKIFLFSVLGIAGAIAALTIYLKLKYPSERLKELLIGTLAKDYGVTVTIARMRVSLFSGFEMEGITIPEVKGGGIVSGRERAPLTIEKITFAYRFSSLFKRNLEINELAVANPVITYWQAPDSTSNLDGLIRAFSDSSGAKPDTAAAHLPFDINLSSLVFSGIQIKASIAATGATQQIAAGPIDLAIHSAQLDRMNNLSAEIELLCRNAEVTYSLQSKDAPGNVDLAAALQSHIRCRLANQDSLSLQGEMTLAPESIRRQGHLEFSLPPINLRTEAGVNLALSRVDIPVFRLALDGEEQVAAQITIGGAEGAATFDVRVDRGRIDLDQLMQIIQPEEDLLLIPALAGVAASGRVEFSGSEFRGDLEHMQFRLALVGNDLSYRDALTGLSCEQGRLRFNYATTADTNETTLSAHLVLDSCNIPLDSTQVLAVGPVEFQVDAALTAGFLPRRGQFNIDLQNISGGSIHAHGQLQSNKGGTNGKISPADWAVNAVLQADSLELSPFTADSVRGRISGELTLLGKNLREVACTLNISNTAIDYLTSDDEGDIPPDQLKMTASLSVPPAFTQIKINDGMLQAGPGGLKFNGKYDLQASAYRFEFSDGMLDLEDIISMLPRHLLGDSLDPAPRIAGRADFNGWFEGNWIAPASSNYNGEFFVRAAHAIYEDSALGLYLDDLRLDSKWSIMPSATTGEFTANSRAPKMPDYLREPLPPTAASGSIRIGEDFFMLTKGRFEIPAWAVAGTYTTLGSFLPNGMQVKTDLDVDLNAKTAISPSAGISLQGKITAKFEIDQYLPDDPFAPQPATISGRLQVHNLNASVDTTFDAHNINANLEFTQDYELRLSNMETGMWLKPSPGAAPAILANAGELLLLEDIFRQTPRATPAGGVPSHLTIAQLQVMGYNLDEVEADLRLGNSRIDVAQLRMKFLDGNMVGNALIGLGDGTPDEINYSAAMQISSIDLSRLHPLARQFERGSRMSADFFVNGSGFSRERLISELTGKLNITKMEKKVASILLQALDPKGTDRGVQNMRLLLKAKWNVRSMSFAIKNGFIYASLEPIKPWFSPFTLPSPIDFARLPMRYFFLTPGAN